MEQRRRMLTSAKDKLISELRSLPEGNLMIIQNGKYRKWYQNHGGLSEYIPKKNHAIAEDLAYKRYLEGEIKKISLEIDAIDAYLQKADLSVSNARRKTDFEYQQFENELLRNRIKRPNKTLEQWMHEDYPRNPRNPENLVHKTVTGIYVRSKSESLIVTVLTNLGIPFRYECLLQIGDIDVYPDFTIRHPITLKEYYHEHFGIMDDPRYVRKAMGKIELYNSYGIIPSVNLLMTFETEACPLDPTYVESLFRFYFIEN